MNSSFCSPMESGRDLRSLAFMQRAEDTGFVSLYR